MEIARVPEEVIGEPVTVNIDGTVKATEVTVPNFNIRKYLMLLDFSTKHLQD